MDGFFYLTSIMDLYSRKLVVPLIICSDCGSQCVSKEYQKATTKMQRSYSKMVFPRDNAYIESFPAIIKCEWFNRFKILDYNHAYRLIFEYLETFYNTTRIHSHCDYKSPDNFEKIFTKMQNESLRIEG